MGSMDPDGLAYGQYCPMSRALEIVGERWTLLIVRDLICGTTRFNDLARGLPGLSRTLLAKRLRQLEKAGIVDHLAGAYVLTPAGRALESVVDSLGGWGARWAFEDPRDAELDPELLVWWMHERIDTTGLPGVRHVVRVEFTDDRRRWWIVRERGVASVCSTDPGYDVGLVLRASVADAYRVWMGKAPLRSALRSGTVVVEGEQGWTRRVESILRLSPAVPWMTAPAPDGPVAVH